MILALDALPDDPMRRGAERPLTLMPHARTRGACFLASGQSRAVPRALRDGISAWRHDGRAVVAAKGRQSGTYKRPIGVVECCDGEEAAGTSLAVLYRAALRTQRYPVSCRLCRRRLQLRNRWMMEKAGSFVSLVLRISRKFMWCPAATLWSEWQLREIFVVD